MFDKITAIVKQGIAWGREVATGNDGMGSASRVVALIVTPSIMGCVVAHLFLNHGLPSAEQLYGVAAIIGAGCGAFAVGKFRGSGPSDPQQPQGGQ